MTSIPINPEDHPHLKQEHLLFIADLLVANMGRFSFIQDVMSAEILGVIEYILPEKHATDMDKVYENLEDEIERRKKEA